MRAGCSDIEKLSFSGDGGCSVVLFLVNQVGCMYGLMVYLHCL